MKEELVARLATEIGTRISLRRHWRDDKPCPFGYHNAMLHIKDIPDRVEGGPYGGKPEDYQDAVWPATCRDCGQPVPLTAERQVFSERLYDTSSGKLEPGCLFWATWYPANLYWDNFEGDMLMAVLPNGSHWNIDSRASNCGNKGDRLHRCWVRHGEPPNVHVDKKGLTCSAGAGSIDAGGWHGFLHNGVFRRC